MKKLNNILSKLNSAFAVERDVTDVTMMQETTPPLPWSVDQNLTEMCCGLSEWDLIEATICGEAAGCEEDARQRVWGVIVNRAMPGTPAGESPDVYNRGVCNLDGYARVIGRKKQFSCWNANHPCGGGDPFASCEALKERVRCLKKLCGNRPVNPGQYTGTSGLDALQRLGFTAEESVKVKHYMTLAAFLGWPYICDEAKNAVRNASGGKKSWVGCVTVTCAGKTHKICSDGCHVFISNVA